MPSKPLKHRPAPGKQVWPLAPYKRPGDSVVDGEPIRLQLRRLQDKHSGPADNAVTADQYLWCCDCELRHHVVYQVFADKGRNFYLQVRHYRDDRATELAREKSGLGPKKGRR